MQGYRRGLSSHDLMRSHMNLAGLLLVGGLVSLGAGVVWGAALSSLGLGLLIVIAWWTPDPRGTTVPPLEPYRSGHLPTVARPPPPGEYRSRGGPGTP